MGVVMRLALTWVGLGLLANTAVATLSEESINELEEELRQVGGPSGVFIDSAEDELFDLLQDNGDNSVPDEEIPEPSGLPEPRYDDDSSEVIESIDEIESITPIKNIQKVKSILPVPDDIAKKFIADHNLVPTDGDGDGPTYHLPPPPQYVPPPPQYGAGSGKYE